MTKMISQLSIRNQIVFGFMPVFILLLVLGFSNLKQFKSFTNNFDDLEISTNETMIFLEIERDMLEIRRNILVYSNTGYRGVLKKISFLQAELEKKFEKLTPVVVKDEEIEDRFLRMLEHYKAFKDGFFEARNRRAEISDIYASNIDPLYKSMESTLEQASVLFENEKQYENAFKASYIHRALLATHNEVYSIRSLHEASRVRSARSNISLMIKEVSNFDALSEVQKQQLSTDLERYHEYFSKAVKVNRTYLHLLNVVLAGRISEVDKLNQELGVLVKQRSEAISNEIAENISRSNREFVFLSIIAILAGLSSLIIIARGISKPVSQMATTLLTLSKGKLDIAIPAQERGDEVGQMANAAEEFKLMAHRLEHQTSELEEFAYRTSHDLRSPLVSSISLLDMAKRNMDKGQYEKAEKSLSLVKKSLTQLDNLVRDILALTRTKSVDEDLAEVNIHQLYDETLEKMQHLSGFSRLKINKHFGVTQPLVTYKSRFLLIFENLVSNAVKYQDYENSHPKIDVRCYSDIDKFVLEIVDNGIGIPEAQREHLFSMFKRFHPKVAFGSGLGLYMMKKSAEILGGDIHYFPNSVGSTFQLIIPHCLKGNN